MTAFCPALCAAELMSHAREHTAARTGHQHHGHHDDQTPHHEHDSRGEPLPDARHTCLCSGNSLTSPTVQVPQMLPLAIAGPDAVDSLGAPGRFADESAHSRLTDPGGGSRSLPLLI